jgi:hypothetical protein
MLLCLVLTACGPDLEPSPDAAAPHCESVCVSVQPPGREAPHCAPTADGGTVCECYEWQTVCR